MNAESEDKDSFLSLSAFIREDPRLKFPYGMRFCIEDHPIEIDRARREQQIEILKRLGEEKALH